MTHGVRVSYEDKIVSTEYYEFLANCRFNSLLIDLDLL